jgi:hypothetical protein
MKPIRSKNGGVLKSTNIVVILHYPRCWSTMRGAAKIVANKSANRPDLIALGKQSRRAMSSQSLAFNSAKVPRQGPYSAELNKFGRPIKGLQLAIARLSMKVRANPAWRSGPS